MPDEFLELTEEQQAWMARVLDFDADQASLSDEPDEKEVWTLELKELGTGLQALKAKADPRLKELAARFAKAATAIKAGASDAGEQVAALKSAMAEQPAADGQAEAAEKAQKAEQRKAAYRAMRQAALDEVGDLDDARVRADREKIETELIGEAATAADGEDLGTAEALLSQVGPRAAVVRRVMERFDASDKALARARKAVEALLGEVVRTERETIERELIAPASAAAGKRQFDAADGLLSRVEQACLPALAIAKRHADYEATLLAAQTALTTLTEAVVADDKANIQRELLDAAGTHAAARRYDEADLLLAQVAARVATAKALAAKAADFALKLAAAKARIALIAHPVAGAKVAAAQLACVQAEARAATPARDYDAAIATLAATAGLCDQAELQVRRYAAGLALAQADQAGIEARELNWRTGYDWQGWTGSASAPGITDVLPLIRQENIVAAEAHATAGRFIEAMRLLEAVAARVATVRRTVNAFIEFLIGNDKQLGAHNAAHAAATGYEVQQAFGRLAATHHTGAFALARTGDYTGALALAQAWTKPRDAVEATSVAWNAAYAAHATLSGLANIAADAGRVWNELIVAAARQVDADDPAGARAKLELAVSRCPLVLAYGNALTAAEQAMAATTMGGDDAAQIRKDLIAAAAVLAASQDYPPATALLLRVPAEAAVAGAADVASKAATVAQDSAQAKLDALATDPAAAVAAVRELMTKLAAHAMAEQPEVKSVIEDMNRTVEQAQAIVDATDMAADTAVQDLEPALELLAKVQGAHAGMIADLGRMGRADSRLAQLRLQVDAIDAAADAEKATIRTDYLDEAADKLANLDMDDALELLAQAELKCLEATRQAELANQYKAALLVAKADLATLTDAFLAPDKAAIQAGVIDAAAILATARDFRRALDTLEPVGAACDTARDILAQKALFDPLRTAVEELWTVARSNIAVGVSNSMPAVPDLDSLHAEVGTTYLDPAAARLAARGTGPLALQTMKEIVKLLADGEAPALRVYHRALAYANANYFYVEAGNGIAALKAHRGQAEVAGEIAAFELQYANADALWNAGLYDATTPVYQSIADECAAATLIADAFGRCDDALVAAQARIDTCQHKVDTLAPAAPAISAALQAIVSQAMAPARTLAASRDYQAAEALLVTVDGRCKTVEDQVDAETLHRGALAAAQLEVARLAQPAVAAEALRLTQQFIDPAKAAAARLDHATAKDLLDKVAAEVAAAAAVGTGAAQAQSARDAVAGELAGPLPAAIVAAEGLLTPLLNHAKAPAIRDLTDAIAAVLAALKLDPPPADATAQLALAADLCLAARVAAERHGAFDEALKAAVAAVDALSDPLVAADALAITEAQIKPARSAAAAPGRDFSAAMARLDAAGAAVAAARLILARETAFKLSLAAAKVALGTLGDLADAANDAIRAGAQAIQTQAIDAAATLAALPARDHAGAEALLKDVAADCKALALRKKAAAGAAPTPAEIADLMKEPGGGKKLDAMVAGLPDNTPRGVMENLIQLRFGLDSFKNLKTDASAKDGTAGKAKSLKKIYDLMARVPDSHTRDNPSLAKLEIYGGKAGLPDNVKRGSYFSGSDKRVVLSCGRPKDSNPQPLADVALALPDVEPDCEMVPDTDVPPPKYFDWTTLHEIGHAIDDKKRFMQSKAGDPAFGGWQTHGADVMPVARAIAKSCVFEGAAGVAYIASCLLGGKPLAPTAPNGRADWEACRLKAVAWCDDIRVGKELWASGGGSAARAVDGRVYHEAYAGSWVSYELAARGKGITGYQFRAPGEWLSELYAAYHCDKLKASHPSSAWLATL